MKAKRQKKATDARLEKIVASAGLALIAVGCIANFYGAYANRDFINDPVDLLYYLRYVILLGGGFGAGYLLAKKRTRYGQLFLGVTYATLAMAFYWLFDSTRAGLLGLFGPPVYPWGKAVFFSMPLLAATATLLAAYLSQYRPGRSSVSIFTKRAMVVSLVTTELYTLVRGIYDLSTGTANYEHGMSIWLIIVSYLTTPLAIAIVSYLFLNDIKKRLDRFFFAALAGAFYGTLTLVLWEFRTNASYDATAMFDRIVTVIAILFVSALLWRVRKAAR